MKHKVGDKVKVHSLDWFKNNCYLTPFGYRLNEKTYTFVDFMYKYCNKDVTIKCVNSSDYFIEEDIFSWEDWMFDDTPKEFNIETDLEAGMIIECNDNDILIVFPVEDGFAVTNDSDSFSWMILNGKTKKEKIEECYGEIKRIRSKPTFGALLSGSILWEYNPIAEVTIEEIAELKGVKPEQIRIKE